jgi:HK97 family phage prohead protease
MQNRAYSILNVKSIQEDQRIITGMATTPQPDRDQDIIDPMGAIFSDEMPLLWQHRPDSPVGHAYFGTPTKAGIPFTAQISKVDEVGELKNLLDRAWQSVKARLVRGVSIGFIDRGSERLQNGGRKFSLIEIIELSLVTIPANTGATIQTVKAFAQNNVQSVYGIPLVNIQRPKPDLGGAIQLLK